MTCQKLFDNFDLLAETPNAVEKMRELVLELAVRGKLVEQEKGEVFLTEAQRHKGELTEEEAPFSIPAKWKWTRLGSVGNIFNGNSTSAKLKQEFEKVTDGLPYIATKDVGYGKNELIYDNGLRVPVNYPRFRIAHKNAVLICAEGGSAGRKIGITDRDICLGNKLFANEVFTGIEPYYIFYWYQSPTFFKEFQSRMTGIIGGISRNNFLSLPIPLPPLAEQKRIVAKVDELMELCDQLEARQQQREQQKTALSRAALARFTAAPTPANLELLFYPSPCLRASVSKTKKNGKISHRGTEAQSENSSFNLHNSSFILHPLSFPTSPEELRKTILDLAVRGKLVPQDPDDEPAENLIKRIERKLLLDKSYNQKDSFISLVETASRHELPKNWAWAQFREVAVIATNMVKPDNFLDYIHLAPDNIEKGNGILLSCSTIRKDKVISGKHHFYPGQIIYSKIRPNLAKVVVVDFEGLCSADMYPINAEIEAHYLHLYMLSESFLEQVVKMDTRVAMPKINQTELNAVMVSVPPLAEQKRIVAKVNELMALVDELETQLTASRAIGEKLLTAIVAELTSSTPIPKNHALTTTLHNSTFLRASVPL